MYSYKQVHEHNYVILYPILANYMGMSKLTLYTSAIRVLNIYIMNS